MSAAEKLRALEPWLAKGSSREVIALVDALPQIVAVVALAENFWGDATPPDEFIAALAALDEQLGDLGSPPTSERSTALWPGYEC